MLSSRVLESCRRRVMGTSGVKVRAGTEPGPCPVCGDERWGVQKTACRQGRTLAHGQFEASEIIFECSNGCRHPSGAQVTHRALSGCLVPNRSVGYDVMVFVGLARFVHHRQREETRAMLETEHGIDISSGQVSDLARLFLEYLGRLHRDRCDQLRHAMLDDGGWPMHVDATGEDGRGTLLVVMSGWRRWVLGAWKITTECSELILPCLRETVAIFGPPLAAMRDLGRAVTTAVDDLISELGVEIPALACHQHFLADVGRDLLDPSHDELRGLFRRTKVRPMLRGMVRDIGRKIGQDIGNARRDVEAWQQAPGHHIETGISGLATARALAQWVLDYKADTTGLDFPFDRPYLDLYDRCIKACRATDAYLCTPPHDTDVVRALERLHRMLDPVVSEVPFLQVTRRLHRRAELFDELRDTLRLAAVPTQEPPEQLADMERNLDDLASSLALRRPERGPAEDMRDAIDLVLAHIEEHGRYLWGHEVILPDGRSRYVDRTNVLIEGLFHTMKHGERRRSGRKVLTQDFEHLPAEAALAYNIEHADYVGILCGSLECLPAAFARLDLEDRQRRGRGESPARASDCAEVLQMASSSLGTADRRVIRTEAMDRKVEAAALSRAPRRPSRRTSRQRATVS